MLTLLECSSEDDLLKEMVSFLLKEKKPSNRILYCDKIKKRGKHVSNRICTSIKKHVIILDKHVFPWTFSCTRLGCNSFFFDPKIYKISNILEVIIEKNICIKCNLETAFEKTSFISCTQESLFNSEIHDWILNTTPITFFFQNGEFFDVACRLKINIRMEEIKQASSYIQSLKKKISSIPEEMENERQFIIQKKYNYKNKKKQIMFPGSMRRGTHFIGILNRLLVSLDVLIKNKLSQELFLKLFFEYSQVEVFEIKACLKRLSLLEKTIKRKKGDCFVSDEDNQNQEILKKILFLLEMFSTCKQDDDYFIFIEKDFSFVLFNQNILKEVFISLFETIWLICLKKKTDPILKKIVGVENTKIQKFNQTKPSYFGMIVVKGNDQVSMGLDFCLLKENVIGNYGRLLVDLSRVVPEGIICYFQDYEQIRLVIKTWTKMGILEEISSTKTVFLKNKQLAESVFYHMESCDRGRGSVLITTLGSGIEWLGLKRKYKRAVVVFGVEKLQFKKEEKLIEEYVSKNCKIEIEEFRKFDLFRKIKSCMEMEETKEKDFNVFLVLVGREFKEFVKEWDFISVLEENSNLSIESAIHKISLN